MTEEQRKKILASAEAEYGLCVSVRSPLLLRKMKAAASLRQAKAKLAVRQTKKLKLKQPR